MIRRLLLCVPLLVILSACQSQQDKFPPLNFVLDPHDHDFAMETTTGTLCKTWEWKHNPSLPIDDLPLCRKIPYYGAGR